jgi:hypothetical protein
MRRIEATRLSGDHALRRRSPGDVPALAARFPIRHILDHGNSVSPGGATSSPRFNAYVELRQKIGIRY